jgi:tetratricopeptide (TPR) repeat protein
VSDDDASVVRSRAAAAIDLRRPEEARRLLAPVIASNPDDAQAFALMAVATARCGEPPSVWRPHADRAAALAPYDASMLAGLADLGRTDGDPQAGMYYVQRALQVAPDHVVALNVLGLLQLDQNPTAALATIDRALERRPDDADIMIARGIALSRLKQYAASQAMYVEALQVDPRNLNALNNLAVGRLNCADLPRASRLLHRAVAEDPHTALYRTNMDAVGATTRRLSLAVLMLALGLMIVLGLVNRWLGLTLGVALIVWLVVHLRSLPDTVRRRLTVNMTRWDVFWIILVVLAVPGAMTIVLTGAMPKATLPFYVIIIGLRLIVPFAVRRISVASGLRSLGVTLP